MQRRGGGGGEGVRPRRPVRPTAPAEVSEGTKELTPVSKSALTTGAFFEPTYLEKKWRGIWVASQACGGGLA